MKSVVQRVASARVVVEAQSVGQIGPGLVVLLGVADDDDERDAAWMAEKVAGLRIFSDRAGKMNLSVTDVEGAVLVVSQFTLLGDCRKGKRPSFVDAAPPETARKLYLAFVTELRNRGLVTETGRFGALMMVHLVNDGPVTLLLDSK
ncbi:MAG TPA: D-aminoacyl-tRNA deacylase [Vicinamibacteria bacterium]|nr:D-aminoacyl-tRNA deacylase [Vicinamibacteria bacterium]